MQYSIKKGVYFSWKKVTCKNKYEIVPKIGFFIHCLLFSVYFVLFIHVIWSQIVERLLRSKLNVFLTAKLNDSKGTLSYTRCDSYPYEFMINNHSRFIIPARFYDVILSCVTDGLFNSCLLWHLFCNRVSRGVICLSTLNLENHGKHSPESQLHIQLHKCFQLVDIPSKVPSNFHYHVTRILAERCKPSIL